MDLDALPARVKELLLKAFQSMHLGIDIRDRYSIRNGKVILLHRCFTGADAMRFLTSPRHELSKKNSPSSPSSTSTTSISTTTTSTTLEKKQAVALGSLLLQYGIITKLDNISSASQDSRGRSDEIEDSLVAFYRFKADDDDDMHIFTQSSMLQISNTVSTSSSSTQPSSSIATSTSPFLTTLLQEATVEAEMSPFSRWRISPQVKYNSALVTVAGALRLETLSRILAQCARELKLLSFLATSDAEARKRNSKTISAVCVSLNLPSVISTETALSMISNSEARKELALTEIRRLLSRVAYFASNMCNGIQGPASRKLGGSASGVWIHIPRSLCPQDLPESASVLQWEWASLNGLLQPTLRVCVQVPASHQTVAEFFINPQLRALWDPESARSSIVQELKLTSSSTTITAEKKTESLSSTSSKDHHGRGRLHALPTFVDDYFSSKREAKATAVTTGGDGDSDSVNPPLQSIPQSTGDVDVTICSTCNKIVKPRDTTNDKTSDKTKQTTTTTTTTTTPPSPTFKLPSTRLLHRIHALSSSSAQQQDSLILQQCCYETSHSRVSSSVMSHSLNGSFSSAASPGSNQASTSLSTNASTALCQCQLWNASKPIIVVEFSVSHVNFPIQNDLVREILLVNAFRIASIGPSLTLVERIYQRDVHIQPSSDGNTTLLQSLITSAASPLQRLCIVITGGKSSVLSTSLHVPVQLQASTKSPIRERLTRVETRTMSTLESIPILFDGIPIDGEDVKEASPTSASSSLTTTANTKKQQHVGLSDFNIKAVIGRGGYGYVFAAKRAIPDPSQIDGERLFAIKMMRKDMVRGHALSSTEMKPTTVTTTSTISHETATSTIALVKEDGQKNNSPTSISQTTVKAPISGTSQPANIRVTVSKRAMAERNILASVSKHPFLVGLRYAFQTREHLFIVTDLCSGGDLYTHMQRKGPINMTRLALYAAELVLALDHLHKAARVVYRDLKPENVLLDGDGHLRLTDFGLSYVTEIGDATSAENPTPTAKVSFCGTESFMAPEVLLRNVETGCSPIVDFWSLGVLLFEAFTGRHPFRGEKHIQTLRNIASKSVKPAGLDKLPVFLANLIEGLLEKNPNKRLGSEAMGGIAQLKRHPFFSLPLGYPMFDGSVLTANHSLSNRGGGETAGVVPGYVIMDFDLVLAKAYLPLYAPNKDASALVVNSTVDPVLAHFDINFLQIPVKRVLEEVSENQTKSATLTDLGSTRDRDGSLAAFSFAGGTSIDGDEDWNKLLNEISKDKPHVEDASENNDENDDVDSDTSSFYDYEEEFELGDLVGEAASALNDAVVTDGGSTLPWEL